MCAQITICEFERRYQDAAAELINSGLGEHFGVVDATMNPDLYDIEKNYDGGEFLLALDGDRLIGTGSLVREYKSI